MSTLLDLASRLESIGKVQGSEGLSNDDLKGYITAALRRHNRAYTIATLPAVEEEAVIYLAWVKLTLVRAGKFAQEASLQGANGYGQDRNTPYTKLMNFAAYLTKEYASIVADLNLNSGSDSIHVGTLHVKDITVDALAPIFANPLIPPIELALAEGESATVGDTLILNWQIESFYNFLEFFLYHIEDDTVYQEWNFNSSSGLPKVNDSAIRVFSDNDLRRTAVKVTGVDKTKANHFLLIVKTRSADYGYSNELVVGT